MHDIIALISTCQIIEITENNSTRMCANHFNTICQDIEIHNKKRNTVCIQTTKRKGNPKNLTASLDAGVLSDIGLATLSSLSDGSSLGECSSRRNAGDEDGSNSKGLATLKAGSRPSPAEVSSYRTSSVSLT